MKKISGPITFFGSGPVAAKSLQFLQQNFDIEAVITKPRPAHHKGDVPVLTSAEQLGLPIYTASNKTQLDVLFNEHHFNSRVGILIDFGIIVSQNVIDFFPLGIINSHFSLLPQLRGADPITFSILNGTKKTGVSLMLLVKAMDEGPLLAQKTFTLPTDITTPKLTDELISLSNQALLEVLPQYIAGAVRPEPQPNTRATYSRRLSKTDSELDWTKPAEQLEREIRAFAEWPKSRTNFGDTEVIITKAHVVHLNATPGTTTIIDKLPAVHCGTGTLVIDSLKPANKKEMSGKAFLAGYQKIFLKARP